jgi:DNA-binding MarR family transcriptional regulator
MRARKAGDRWTEELLEALEVFRELDPYMPVARVLLFLLIAQRPGITQTELRPLVGLSTNAVALNVRALRAWRGRAVRGLDLVTVIPDPVNGKRRLLYLSPKGQEVVAKLRAIGTQEPPADAKPAGGVLPCPMSLEAYTDLFAERWDR